MPAQRQARLFAAGDTGEINMRIGILRRDCEQHQPGGKHYTKALLFTPSNQHRYVFDGVG